jgi:hypothetical protein
LWLVSPDALDGGGEVKNRIGESRTDVERSQDEFAKAVEVLRWMLDRLELKNDAPSTQR